MYATSGVMILFSRFFFYNVLYWGFFALVGLLGGLLISAALGIHFLSHRAR